MCVTCFLNGGSSGACHLVYDALPLVACSACCCCCSMLCFLLPNCDVLLVVVVIVALSLMCVQGCRVCKCDDRDNNKGQSRATFGLDKHQPVYHKNGTILTDQTLHLQLLRTHLLAPASVHHVSTCGNKSSSPRRACTSSCSECSMASASGLQQFCLAHHTSLHERRAGLCWR